MLKVNTSVLGQKVDLRRTFYFDTRIPPEVRGFIKILFAAKTIAREARDFRNKRIHRLKPLYYCC